MYVFYRCPLLGFRHSLLFLLSLEVLSGMGAGFCQILVPLRWSYVFVGVGGVFSLVI